MGNCCDSEMGTVGEGACSETKSANTLTLKDIEAAIVSKEVATMGRKTTVVCLTLQNGFEVVGTASCVDPENYDVTKGEPIALKKAMDKIWELEGYMLQGWLKAKKENPSLCSEVGNAVKTAVDVFDASAA